MNSPLSLHIEKRVVYMLQVAKEKEDTPNYFQRLAFGGVINTPRRSQGAAPVVCGPQVLFILRFHQDAGKLGIADVWLQNVLSSVPGKFQYVGMLISTCAVRRRPPCCRQGLRNVWATPYLTWSLVDSLIAQSLRKYSDTRWKFP